MIKNRKIQLYFAAFLMVCAFALFVTGTVYYVKSDTKIIDPLTGVDSTSDIGDTVSVTPADQDQVASSDSGENTSNPTDTNNPTNTDNSTPANNNKPSNSGNNTNNNGSINNNDSQYSYVDNSAATINNQKRREIENRYGITVKYGYETVGYSVRAGNTIINSTPILNDDKIQSALNDLSYTLQLYPQGMFKEIKDGGIPLTILLLDSYSDTTITGITDSDYSHADISIAMMYPFAESFYHESYHYIERYLFKQGANYNTWDSLNPAGFSWGNVSSDNSYSRTFSPDAPFVNDYAQTAPEEDRASTFEYMMASSKASCLNYNKPVWKKADLMAKTIEVVLNSVSPNSRESWEKHLY